MQTAGVGILGAVKWELSLAESKMGETWRDGGPPLLGLALPAVGYCSAEITMILQSQHRAAQGLSLTRLFATNITLTSVQRSLHSYYAIL